MYEGDAESDVAKRREHPYVASNSTASLPSTEYGLSEPPPGILWNEYP